MEHHMETGLSQHRPRRTRRRPRFEIRYWIRRDLAAVLAIDEACAQWDCWTADDHLWCARQVNVIALVVEESVTGRIVGFVVYALEARSVRILRLAVHPDHQSCGVGTLMVDKMLSKLTHSNRRSRVVIDVDEQDVQMCGWLSGQGFIGTLIRGWNPDMDIGGDGIRFEWRVPDENHA